MQSERDDTELLLLAQIAEGDETAFRAMYDAYRDRFYGVALKLSGSEYIAEEVLQEVFISVWKSRNLLPNVTRPSAYLFSIFYNCLKQHFRKEAMDRKMKLGMIPQDFQTADIANDEKQEKEELFQLLDKAVNILPTQQATVYRLTKEEGLSRKQVAEKMGIAPNTVKNHLADAIRTIKNIARQLGIFALLAAFFEKLF